MACVQFVPLYGGCGSLQGRTPTRTVSYAIFRLAHAVAGDLPQLDDIARLAELANVSYTVPDEVVRTVLATGFFFELDEAPTRARPTTDAKIPFLGSLGTTLPTSCSF